MPDDSQPAAAPPEPMTAADLRVEQWQNYSFSLYVGAWELTLDSAAELDVELDAENLISLEATIFQAPSFRAVPRSEDKFREVRLVYPEGHPVTMCVPEGFLHVPQNEIPAFRAAFISGMTRALQYAILDREHAADEDDFEKLELDAVEESPGPGTTPSDAFEEPPAAVTTEKPSREAVDTVAPDDPEAESPESVADLEYTKPTEAEFVEESWAVDEADGADTDEKATADEGATQ